MSDLISRQAAIDALRMDISIIPYAKAREYVREAIETIYNRLEELPSAQPEERTKERAETHACDCISRQAAVDVVRKCNVKEVTPAYMLIDKAEAMTELMMLPSAESERKKGKWNQIISIPNDMFGRYYCSECGKEGNPFWYFCPNCGADMRGTGDNSDE